MKLEIYNKRVSEATIQAEFYHRCRESKIRCYLEYKYERSRFDAVLYDENKNIYAIVEFKSRTKECGINKDGRQYKKYSQYKIPIIYVMNIKAVELAIIYIKQNGKNVQEVCFE